jgi:hypothetical protein
MIRKIVGGFLLLFSAFFISLLVTHTALVLNKTPPALLKWLPDLTIGLLPGIDAKSLKPEQYTALITIITLAVGFLIAIFGLLRRTGKLQEEVKSTQKEFLAEHGITINPVKRKGKDDLEWMLPHYQQADRVIICAGSFDWLGDNKEMKERIRQLAAEDHLKLVSYKTKKQVEAAFQREGEQELFRELEKHFGYESGLEGVTCTMIQRLGADYEFLYRSRADAENAFNVSYISTTPRNIELLYILSELTKAVERRSEHTPDSSSTEQG